MPELGVEVVATPGPAMSEPWEAWRSVASLERFVEFDQNMLTASTPDVVVVDGRISTIIAAEAIGVPVVSVVRDAYTPGHEFGVGGDGFWDSMVDPVSHSLNSRRLVPLMADPRELFVRHPSICPSSADIEEFPSATRLERIHFTGLITWTTPNDVGALDVGQGDVLVYGVLRDAHDVDRLVDAFSSTSHRLVVAMPNSTVKARIGVHCEGRIVARPYVPLDKLGHLFAGAVVHGGHGICLTVLTHAIPTVFVPPGDRVEQRANAERLQRLGHGAILEPDDGWAEIPRLLRGVRVRESRPGRPLEYRLRAAIDFITRSTTSLDPLTSTSSG